MIIDSTALLEQATRDIVASVFQSAGQCCSALRLLVVQQDIEKPLIDMLKGAAEELRTGNPAFTHTDIGPVIDAEAKALIDNHCAKLTHAGKLVFKGKVDADAGAGHFVPSHIFKLDNIPDLERKTYTLWKKHNVLCLGPSETELKKPA